MTPVAMATPTLISTMPPSSSPRPRLGRRSGGPDRPYLAAAGRGPVFHLDRGMELGSRQGGMVLGSRTQRGGRDRI
jgi:hypothetical protein